MSRTGEKGARVVRVENGVAAIPDELLTVQGQLHVYVVGVDDAGRMTEYKRSFVVAARQKPDDYVWGPTELKRWEQLEERIETLERNETIDHSKLLNRDAGDQHPISAITGLPDALDSNERAALAAMQAAQEAGGAAGAAQKTADDAVSAAGKAQSTADDAAAAVEKAQGTADTAKTATASLKNQITTELYGTTEKTLATNDDFEWQGGWYHNDGTLRNHPIFKRSRVFKTLPGTTITYKNLRSPANYVACIACFKDGKYDDAACLKGESFLDFSSGTFVVPENILSLIHI